MNKATKTIELAKGVEIAVIVTLNVLHTEGDIWEGRVGKYEIWYTTDFELRMNGETYTASAATDYTTNENVLHKIKKLDDSIKATITFGKDDRRNGKPVKIQLRAENAEKLAAAIEEAKEAVATDESRAFFAEKEAAAKEVEIAEAKQIICKAKEYLKNNDRLRTNAEREEWERNYNNVVNEGGEGFVPHYVSKEEYDWAKSVIAKNK